MSSRHAFVEQLMGMPVSIHLRGDADAADRAAATAEVYRELREVDRVFSTYQPDSDISRLRRGEVTVAQCAPVVADVLALCAEAKAATDGYFDADLPDGDGVRRLDPSGLVKGWAVERAARHLAALGGDDWYLNAGGDIALGLSMKGAQGSKGSPGSEGWPGGVPWRIGIEDPHRPDQLLGVAALSGGAIATSGTARRGAHILDPRSGRPAVSLASVTVVGPSLLRADVLATATMARGGVDVDRWPEGYDAIVVAADGQRQLWPGPAQWFTPQ